MDKGRGGKTTLGNGQAWSSASPRGQWRTGENEENWLQNHLWCPNDPRKGIDDDDNDGDDDDDEFLDRLGRRGNERTDSAEILFQYEKVSEPLARAECQMRTSVPVHLEGCCLLTSKTT